MLRLRFWPPAGGDPGQQAYRIRLCQAANEGPHAETGVLGVAMVFQNYALYPHMTVRENMGFALRFAGVPEPEIAKQVDEAARIDAPCSAVICFSIYPVETLG